MRTIQELHDHLRALQEYRDTATVDNTQAGHWAVLQPGEARLLVTEHDRLTAERDAALAQLTAAQKEAADLSGFVEACDAVGFAIAEHDGKPYDRATCWGEATLDLRDAVLAMRGQLAAEKARADELHTIAARQAKELAEACKALALAERVIDENRADADPWRRRCEKAEAERDMAKELLAISFDYEFPPSAIDIIKENRLRKKAEAELAKLRESSARDHAVAEAARRWGIDFGASGYPNNPIHGKLLAALREGQG